jgi:hypothetical protein
VRTDRRLQVDQLAAGSPGDAHLTVEPDYSDARDLCEERIERRVHEGREIVVKRARGPARTALRREATILESLDGDGVVELVDHRSAPSGDELWTVDGGPASLADPWNGTPAERAAWFGDGCRRLADLHARGWFHGAVTLDHLVVDGGGGTTRWCSLGSAGRIADDPAGQRLDRIAITRAAHRLARSLTGSLTLRRRLDRLGDEADPRRIARAYQQWARRRAGRRPGRGLPALPAPRLPRRPRLPRLPRLHRRREARSTTGLTWRRPVPLSVRQLPAALAATVAVIGALVVAVGTLRSSGWSEPRSPEPTDLATATTSGPDGSGPGEVAPSVVLGERTVRVGRAGDVAVTADARCAGVGRVFVLRPSTGEVFDFPTLPLPAVGGAAAPPTTGRLLRRESGLVGLVAPDGCGPPLATRRDGSTTPVIPP